VRILPVDSSVAATHQLGVDVEAAHIDPIYRAAAAVDILRHPKLDNSREKMG
jgi:hypothetical protein